MANTSPQPLQSTSRVASSEWDTKPIHNPVTASWNLLISPGDAKKMMQGSIPQAMEDKWLCYSDAPDAQGAVYVHLCRSWTMAEILVLKLQSASADDADRSWIITEITWARKEGKQDLGEEVAKVDAAEICNGVLKCDMPVEDESELEE